MSLPEPIPKPVQSHVFGVDNASLHGLEMTSNVSKDTVMKAINNSFMILTVSLFLAVPSTGIADYEIPWSTIDGGGGVSIGGDYTVHGTIGQPDAGTMTGGNYALEGGFWSDRIPCLVDLADLTYFLDYWLNEPAGGIPADFNGDEHVDLQDFAYLSTYWMHYCPNDWPW